MPKVSTLRKSNDVQNEATSNVSWSIEMTNATSWPQTKEQDNLLPASGRRESLGSRSRGKRSRVKGLAFWMLNKLILSTLVTETFCINGVLFPFSSVWLEIDLYSDRGSVQRPSQSGVPREFNNTFSQSKYSIKEIRTSVLQPRVIQLAASALLKWKTPWRHRGNQFFISLTYQDTKSKDRKPSCEAHDQHLIVL